MKRAISNALIAWKQQPERLPLLVRGARQIGKTYTIEQFGQNHFESVIAINFELHPEFKACFATLDPAEITTMISALSRQRVIPGKTLLFLDEIQECPNAIVALRYFKERMPDLHVIGAGSLLEFAMNDEHFRMPVGRVQYCYMRPVSFREYLKASGDRELDDLLSEVSLVKNIPDVLHKALLKRVREYMILGGMPAVLDNYFKYHELTQCQQLQTALLSTHRSDFGKYSPKTNHQYLQSAFEKAPAFVGQPVKYVKIDRDIRSRDLKLAIDLLERANLLYPVYATAASGLPLGALINHKKFKIIFLDIGLVNRLTRIDIETLLKEKMLLINQGALAEQFVGQELLAYSNWDEEGQVYFWSREKQGSSAEVDFVTAAGSVIVPIEVKAGATGKLKSLRLFMEEKHGKIGVRICQQALMYNQNILSVPFYLISELDRLIMDCLS